MNKLKTLAIATTLGLASFAGAAYADDLEAVQTFYDYLSNPGSEEHANAFLANISDDWESVGDYTGKNKSAEGLVGQLSGFAQLVPDLDWAVEAMHQADNFVTVRSRATGTPVAPFFGVDGEGRSFDIMTIDVHEIEDGKIIRSYHVEDWAGALQQLSGQ